MKERWILFKGEMVRAILDGRKTQTRRVVKPQPDHIYGLTDDRLTCFHSVYEQLCNTETDPRITERRLSSWQRWPDILTNSVRGLWAQGVRGLVSVEGAPGWKGLPARFNVPQQQEGDEGYSPIDLHCVSWPSPDTQPSGSALGREPDEQPAEQSCMGNSDRELGGQRSSRTRDKGREASLCQANRRGAKPFKMVLKDGIVQPTQRGSHSWHVPGFNLSVAPFFVGQSLWVRETWRCDAVEPPPGNYTKRIRIAYGAGGDKWFDEGAWKAGVWLDAGKWRPSIFMPRWASRITLEIVSVRVERLREITEADALSEGIKNGPIETFDCGVLDRWGMPKCLMHQNAPAAYACLWDSINAKTHPWSSNPYVWVVEFRRIIP